MARGRGADSPGEKEPSDIAIRARLRTLIDGGIIPPTVPRRMWVGKCHTAHTCIACGVMIELGESEFEWTNDVGVVFFLHGRCTELYREFRQ